MAPLLGQASGGWTESSSALRLLHVGIRNTVGVLTADCFTQTNPPAVLTNVSTRVDPTIVGVISGSVAFTRPDGGSNHIGGAGNNAAQVALQAAQYAIGFRALGCFINSANGNAYENTPGVASGKGPYVAAMGTYGNALYETALIAQVDAAHAPAGMAIVYRTGNMLMASRNGYLMPTDVVGSDGVIHDCDLVAVTAESFVQQVAGRATRIGVLKMVPDATQTELVYDQRI